MKILWAENPLRTVVALDDADRALLREKLKSEYLESRLVSAKFAIDPEWNKNKTLEERAAMTLKVLDLDYLLGDVERNGKFLDQYLDELLGGYVDELASEHLGDCICTPCSCTKCRAEELLGIDTIKGLGKHSALKIKGAFGDGATINQAVAKLENYHPGNTPPATWKREDWDKHVPRWIEEGKAAHAWLVAYRDEHHATQLCSKEQEKER